VRSAPASARPRFCPPKILSLCFSRLAFHSRPVMKRERCVPDAITLATLVSKLLRLGRPAAALAALQDMPPAIVLNARLALLWIQ
jgi:hypothetical protein